MAKIRKGILGGFTGKVGTVIGYNWRGQDMMRALPTKSKKVPSPLQLEQQEKFTLVMLFLNPIRPFLDLYYQRRQGLKSRFNMAVGQTLKHAVIPDPGGGFMLDYSKVLISTGSLRILEGAGATAKADTVLGLTWTDTSGQGNAVETDQLIGICYCPDLNSYHLFEQVAERADESIDLPMPAEFSGREAHVWVSMVSSSGKRAAMSTYLGLVTLT